MHIIHIHIYVYIYHFCHRSVILDQDIYWDLDGSLTGTANSYTSWADSWLGPLTVRWYRYKNCCFSQPLG